MGEQQRGEFVREVALEFAAVVGQDRFDSEGEHGLNQAEELRRGGAGVAAGGAGPGEVRMQIGAGDDVAALVEGAQLDAVQGHAMAGTLSMEMLRLAHPGSAYRRRFAVAAKPPWPGAHFI